MEPEPTTFAAHPSVYAPGSRDDFDRLYRDSYPRILATLIGVLRNRALAEECAQETFVRAFRSWSRWKPDAPAEAWLHRIALNTAISARRRERLHDAGEYVRRLGRGDAAPDPAGSERTDLLAALDRLPVKQSTAVILRYFHGYSNRDMAAALGIPERTVASRLAAARERLRQLLNGPGGAGMGITAAPGVVSDDGAHKR